MKEIFSKRLKSARVLASLSQDQLVEKMENAVSKNAISKYEKGEMMADSTVLLALSKALNVKPDYFFRPFTVEIEKVEFSTDSSHKVGIVDFWVADEDNIFVATSIGEASDNKVLLSRLDENTKVTNYSTLVSSKDMFPVTGLPQKELNGEFSYFVYSEENYPAFIKYYQEFHQLPSFSLIKDTYVHQDYPEITIQKEKIDEIANLFQSRLKPHTILFKKL